MRSSFVLAMLAAVVLFGSCSSGGVPPAGNRTECNNRVQDGMETDLDCGGPDCAICADGLGCLVNEDCASSVCLNAVCVSCNDGARNQDESDIDCGGVCDACAAGSPCNLDSDCGSGDCQANRCVAPPNCGDGIQNRTETDIDCGGGCFGCDNGGMCLISTDCESLNCAANTCAPQPTCDDGILNQDETDVDCGGMVCSPCPGGDACVRPVDCVSGLCQTNVCTVPVCGDGVVNQMNEVCDDGNTSDNDACAGDCSESFCFIGVSHATVQEAIDDDNCTAAVIPSGTITENLMITRNFSLVGADANSTVLDGGGSGAVITMRRSTVSIADLTIQNGDSSAPGGGVFAETVSLTLERVVVRANRTDNHGGGLYVLGGSVVELTDVRLEANTAALSGGGAYFLSTAPTIRRTTISGNSASIDAGGLHLDGGGAIVNATISGNSAINEGGGLVFARGAGALINATVTQNQASRGGGLFVRNAATGSGGGHNIVFANTAATSGPDCQTGLAPWTSNGFNLFGSLAGCFVTGATSSDSVVANAGLGPLQDNGGFAATHSISQASPATNGGTAGGCVDQTGVALTVDQRRQPRTGACDIGAFER